jgi:hypothetical protein
MRNSLKILSLVLLAGLSFGASKPHVISFGKAILARWFVGADESHSMEIKVKPLYIDGRLKEFTLGRPHDVTDHLFVVRRAFRLNDALPDQRNTAPIWQWQRGGWLLVDRVSGHVSLLALPEFDNYYSASSWYRDYVAYCGASDNGEKLYAVVAQIGRRKAILRKSLGSTAAADTATDSSKNDLPDSECPAPSWQRQPARVTFAPKGQSFSYSIRGHDAEVLTSADGEEGTE